MNPDSVAWLVLGEKKHVSVYLEELRAVEKAVFHRGVCKALVLAEDVSVMLRQAYERGLQEGRSDAPF